MSDAPRDPTRLHLLVLTPEEILFEGEVLWAQVPLVDGLAGVWPGHAPLVGRIDRGTVEYATPAGVEQVGVAGGVLRVDEERCIVLASTLVRDDAEGWSATGAGAEMAESDDEVEAILESALSGNDVTEPRDG